MMKTISHGLKSGFLAHALSSGGMGQIHSIFQNSFNAVLGNQLIHFGKSLEGVSSFGVALEEGQLLDLKRSLQLEDRIKMGADSITIYTRSTIWRLRLDTFQEADCWVREGEELDEAVLSNALERLEAMGLEEHTGVIGDERDRQLLRRFLEVDSGDADFHHPFVAHFIGRGIGLTPSGDDFLLGYAMMCRFTGQFRSWLAILDEEMEGASTTDVSRSYYQALVQGFASSQFVDFLRALRNPQSGDLDKAIEKILQYGHTSGWDTLLGITLFLRKLKKETSKN